MAKIGKITGKNGLNIYPSTIPQAVIDPNTSKNLRDELDELYSDTIIAEEDSEDVDNVGNNAADTATKALNDWDGNDIRVTYLKDSPSDGKQYVRKNGAWHVQNAVTVDASMSASSTNPVQNKVVKSYIDSLIITTLNTEV